MRRLFQRNGLSIVLITLFLVSFIAQSIAGHRHYNQEQQEHQQPTVRYQEYITGSHFLEATMENWESEFLQMFFFITLTVFLYQKGSAESKDPDKDEKVDEDPVKARTKNSFSRKERWMEIEAIRTFALIGLPLAVSSELFSSCKRRCS